MSGSGVVVIGGGVMGLSVAYVLAAEGVAVELLDSGPLGRAASWAGAGIVSPGSERPPKNSTIALRTLSARLHAEWSAALREETGIDNGYRPCGGVDVAWTDREEHDLGADAGRWRDEGIAFERLPPGDFARVEPALNPELRAVYFLPDRAQIRNPWHLRALIEACRRRGVRLRPGCGAEGFEVRAGRVVAVRTAEGRSACDAAVVAAGPWSGRLLEGLGLRVPTPPVRGQIVLLKSDRPQLRRIVEHGSDYLVPRDDGRVLVGSTEEDAGFEVRTTPEALERLHAEALRLCPALADAEVEATWAGLRPGSRDTKPYIGPAPGVANLFVAAGHKRSGLQLSPGTAVVVADLVLGRPPAFDLEPFRLDRPPAEPVADAFRS